MKNYYRIMLGPKSVHAEECYKGNYIGAGFGIEKDLSNKLPDNWRYCLPSSVCFQFCFDVAYSYSCLS